MIGTKLGHYEITAHLGSGGMGDVYQATDTKLGRHVAVKFLPEAFVHDIERVARFQREARVLAQLSHPNIAVIYGLEESAGRTFLVMELVPDETLAGRIAKGSIPIEEALAIAIQIAAALEAAHEKGITHRDLKPSNIKLTSDGTIKVLDFGLAKVSESAAAVSAADSPTLTIGATHAGVIMGTASYMSPEQARGKMVDKRADIWAFGVVLYEILTGQQLFGGEDISEIMAKVIRDEPNLDAIPGDLRPLLRRCLEKDSKKRQRDIGDVRIELQHALDLRSSSSRIATAVTADRMETRRHRLDLKWTIAVAALSLIIGTAAGSMWWRRLSASSSGVVRLSVSVPRDIRLLQVSFAGDARTLVISGIPRRADGTEEPPARLYTRRLDEYDFKPIAGTEGSLDFRVSPNGEWIAFVATISEQTTQQQLKKVRVDGSAPPIALIDWEHARNSFVWSSDDELLVLAEAGTKFFRLPAAGGSPKPAIKIDTGFVAEFASWIGGNPIVGDHGLFLNLESWGPRGYQVDEWVVDMATGKAQRLFENAGNGVYSPTGHIVFARGESLLAAPFDARKLTVSGDVTALANGLRVSDEGTPGIVELSRDGALVYAPGGRVGTDRQLIIVDAAGNISPFTNERRTFDQAPHISRDGRKAAVVLPTPRGTYETWVADLDRPGLRRVIALPNADCSVPIWSPDGQQLAYIRLARDKDDGIYVQRENGVGSPLPLVKPGEQREFFTPASWTPDGSGLLSVRTSIADGKGDIVLVSASAGGKPEQPQNLVAAPSNEMSPRISPDGQLLAFASDESGKFEIYVAPFAAGKLGPKVVVSGGAGVLSQAFGSPIILAWAADSRRLYYYKDPNKIVFVTIDTKPAITASAPVIAYDLAKLRVNPYTWDIMPDGRLLAIQRGGGEDEVTQFNIVLNWFTELRQRTAK